MDSITDWFEGVTPLLPEPRTITVPSSGPASIAGLKLAFREAGPTDAPALVMLHGIGSNSTGFRNQFTGFNDGFRAIAWDAPGYGESNDFAADAPPASDYADALAALLDALLIQDCHLVGSSMGALIAVTFAARYPGRAKTLILSGPTTGRGAGSPIEREAAVRGRIEEMDKLGPEGLAERRAAFLLAPDAPPHVVRAAHDVMARTRPRGYAQAARMVAGADILPEARRIVTPTLICRGTEDKLGSGAQPLQEAIRDSELQLFTGVGHLIKLEAPGPFNACIRNFISKRHR